MFPYQRLVILVREVIKTKNAACHVSENLENANVSVLKTCPFWKVYLQLVRQH